MVISPDGLELHCTNDTTKHAKIILPDQSTQQADMMARKLSSLPKVEVDC